MNIALKSKKSGLPVMVMAYLIALPCLSACSRLEICYIEDAEEAAPPLPSSQIQVNYFFDRTESLRGFTRRGVETDYDRALDSLISVGQTLGYEKTAFYEYGENRTDLLAYDKDALLNAIKDPAFYGLSHSPGEDGRKTVKLNNGQPFRSVSEYIKDLGGGGNYLNFIITDLYEQRGRYEYFHLAFQNAFAAGDSGAIFAVTSGFQGRIYSISAVDERKFIDVKNGNSTIFIFITGSKEHIKNYSSAFAGQLAKKNIPFNKTLFLLGESGVDGIAQPEIKTAGNKKRFEAEGNQYVNLNVRRNAALIKTWEALAAQSGKTGFKPKPADAEAYILLTNIGSQYVYKTAAMDAGASALPAVENVSVEYFSGTKTARGEISKFEALTNPAMFIRTAVLADGGYDYFKLEIDNKSLKKGYYRVKFDIVPDWVEFLDAPDIPALEASAGAPGGGQTIKVLNVGIIYNNILKEFNRADGFSKVIYLVKN
jgi:hypothetical protein